MPPQENALVPRDDEPDASLLNPHCRKCSYESNLLIHVITHECLEGDALRCVIKAVPDTAPLDPDDYMKVADLLKWLPDFGPKAPEPTASAIGGGAASATSSADVPASVVTAAPSPDNAQHTDPVVIILTATADDGSTTITTTTTLNSATSAPAATGDSASGPTATPLVDLARTNRIVRPAGRPAYNRVADGRIKDAPMSKMVNSDIFRRTDTEGTTPAFSIKDFFTNHKDIHFPKIAHHEHQNQARSDIKISESIAKIILASDETLNPNSALLRKLRPHLAVSPREEPISTKDSTAVYYKGETAPAEGSGLSHMAPNAAVYEAPQPYGSSFLVSSPYDKAILGLLCVMMVGAIAGVATMVVKKRKAKTFSRV